MGMRDRTVEPGSGFAIYDQIGSEKKALTLLHNSNHILSSEPDADLLFSSIRRFVEHRVIDGKKGHSPKAVPQST